MPPLEPPEVAPPRITASRAVRGGVAGLPLQLERLSAKELATASLRFGVDIPYTATPTGWGEWIPVFPNEPCDGFVVVLAQPTGLVV